MAGPAQPVQSVGRALDLLEALADGPPLGVVELARQVGLAQGTTHRLLATLAARGYVRQDGERRYHLGLAGARLADRAQQELALLARPHLATLVEQTGETANLAVLDGTRMRYVAQSPSPHTLRIFAEVGRQVPVHSTAVGKAVLAALPAADAQAVIDALTLEPSTRHTVTTRAGLDEALVQVRRAGYAVDEQEQEIGVRCVGVALPAALGLRAAVSVSGPAERFSEERARQVGPLLAPVAAALAAALR